MIGRLSVNNLLQNKLTVPINSNWWCNILIKTYLSVLRVQQVLSFMSKRNDWYQKCQNIVRKIIISLDIGPSDMLTDVRKVPLVKSYSKKTHLIRCYRLSGATLKCRIKDRHCVKLSIKKQAATTISCKHEIVQSICRIGPRKWSRKLSRPSRSGVNNQRLAFLYSSAD